MKKKILITGGAGFLGFYLVKKLLKKGNRIVVFDNNFRSSFSKFNKKYKKKITLIKGDIRNKKALFNAAKGCKIVYHLAFINGTKNFYEVPRLVLDVGVQGTINILNFCLKNSQVEEFYFASSSEVYHNPKIIPTNEKTFLTIPDPQNPRFSYAGGKLIGEILTLNYLRNTKIKHNIFRPHNLFGPNMGFEHVIPEVLFKVYKSSNKWKKKECSINIQGSGRETRSFCYIEDAINQIEAIQKKGKNREIYHVGQSKEITISNLIKKIEKIMNTKIKIIRGNLREGSALRRSPNINKIKNLGYGTKNNFNYGLVKTIRWYKKFYLNNEF